jgi:transposase-like protein
MGAKRYSTEQIIVKLRQAEIEMGRGVKVPEVCRKLRIAEQSFYRWRKRYGGLDRSEVRRLKALEQENARLKKLLAESMIDSGILKEAVLARSFR